MERVLHLKGERLDLDEADSLTVRRSHANILRDMVDWLTPALVAMSSHGSGSRRRLRNVARSKSEKAPSQV
jgi:hypothetical protein